MVEAYYNLFIALEKNAGVFGNISKKLQPLKDKALSAYIKVNHSPILSKLQKPGQPKISLQSFGGLSHLAGQGMSSIIGGASGFRSGGGRFGGAGASGMW